MPAEWFWNRALNSWGHPFANGYACLISEGQYQRDGPLTRCPVCGWHPTPPPPPIASTQFDPVLTNIARRYMADTVFPIFPVEQFDDDQVGTTTYVNGPGMPFVAADDLNRPGRVRERLERAARRLRGEPEPVDQPIAILAKARRYDFGDE
jgi:hypothetical protein